MIKKGRVVEHPGLVIKDAIEELGLSQSEFAYRVGLSIKNVSTLVNGESNITFDVALKLSSFFGNSVEGWINLQTKYDLYLNEAVKQKEYQEDWQIVKYFNKQFSQDYLGINIDSKQKEATIDSLRRCFHVSCLKNLNETDMYAFCKTSILKDVNEKTIILRNAWISLAENEARNISCSEFNKEIIFNNRKYIRSLTLLHPNDFYPILKELLAKAGIKLVILPYLPGSNVSGVTKWIPDENSVMVAVNDCGKDADRIWFTICHEIGHAIKNHKRHMTISYDKNNIIDNEEIEANKFASDTLIDPDKYQEFIKKGKFNLYDIKRFAKEQNVADFIVIGRLQKDKYIPWSMFSEKKIKYEVIS